MEVRQKVLGYACFLLMLFWQVNSTADDFDETINDQIDAVKATPGRQTGNFITVPIPLSNPTLGTGLQLALLYLHPQQPGKEDIPNSTSGLGAMYTDSDSRVLGAFHDDYLLQDRLRLKLAVASAELNVDYFGSGQFPALAENPIEYNLDTDLVYGQVLYRIPATNNWFGGLRAAWMSSSVKFNQQLNNRPLPDLANKIDVVNFALVANYDDTNDNYYPTSGKWFEAILARDDQSWGSSFNFDRYTASYNQYFPVRSSSVIAFRTWASEVRGNAPFFLLPALDMRGFASGRYQDNAAISAHIEWREKFSQRWGFIASVESGRVADSFNDLGNGESVNSIGAGIRWQVSSDQSMHLGLDVGYSEGETAVYLRIGEKF
ncbi:MAG: BamA/TamA family outer membrane protein [Pseudomonadales bacterium]|nr:BamA/TamA family outer membrane protein [Pseudomonadales bacterium]